MHVIRCKLIRVMTSPLLALLLNFIILFKELRQLLPKITPEHCSSSKDKQQDLLLPENNANAWTKGDTSRWISNLDMHLILYIRVPAKEDGKSLTVIVLNEGIQFLVNVKNKRHLERRLT